MSQAIIFDIDGTLADLSHRLHFVTNGAHDWPAFFDAMGEDGLHEEIAWLASVVARDGGVSVLLTTGRPESHRKLTEAWLLTNGIPYDQLYMRPTGDHRPDTVVKSQMLDAILADGYEVKFVVDDRPVVVQMWRSRGLVCLQCRTWDERAKVAPGLLTLMVGPSGAGKSAWLESGAAAQMGIRPDQIVSSDQIRADLCGDFRDQTKNDEVFAALHAVVRTRIQHGLPTVVDATNIKRKDRLTIVDLAPLYAPVRYVVINRPMDDKRRDGGWRNELPIDLLAKHEATFQSQLSDILVGDGRDNVTVVDVRGVAS